jgi:PAS domain S-box-containing protein/diguanylate cyclase (GGDEF)-like protein
MSTTELSATTPGIASVQMLIVEDSADDFELSVRTLENAQLNINAVRAASRESFSSLVATYTYDVIVADYNLPGWTGMEALKLLRAMGNDTPLIILTGALGEEAAVECIKEGAADLILKTHLNTLPAAVRRAIFDATIRESKKRAEASLRESEARFRTLADSIASAVLIYQGTECRYANRAAQTLTGYSEKELLGLSSWDLVHPECRSLVVEQSLDRVKHGFSDTRYEMRILTKQGEVRWLDVTAGRIEMDNQPAGLLTAVDITKRKEDGEDYGPDGARDALTGLLSVAQLHKPFRTEAKRSERTGRSFAMLLLKVDALQQMNQHFGFPAVGRTLCKLSYVVGAVCRSGDLACRYEEDEFVLLLPETTAAGVRQLAIRIAERLYSEPTDPPFTISAGSAVFPQDGPSIEHLARVAARTLRRVENRTSKKLARSA